MSVILLKGPLPRWLPEYRLASLVAPMRVVADRCGGDVEVETKGDTVHITCVTADGLACVACGCSIAARVRRVSRFGAKHHATRTILISTCDPCGGAL